MLTELGWLEMLAAEPRDAVDVVFTTLGAHERNASVVDDVLAVALGLDPSPDPRCCSRRSDRGRRRARPASPRVGSAPPPSWSWCPTAVAGSRSVPAVNVAITPVHGVDPDAGWCVVQVEDSGRVTTALDAGVWEEAVAAGQRALALQLSGACRTMLALAREHAIERVQFGRPVVRFQAVRHRLAEALVAIEALDATVTAAWDEPGPMTAALAKASAGRAARTVARHCQQVLAGIGFTTDHPFHRYLKRTLVLEGVLGGADDLVTALGHTLIATRTAPTLVDL